jgi:hypothetical protein
LFAVLTVLYFWDAIYNNGMFSDGAIRMEQSMYGALGTTMKFATPRPYADPETAARAHRSRIGFTERSQQNQTPAKFRG